MATSNPRRKLRQDGTVAWQARYRDPDGRQRAKEFTKKVDAERFLATTRADMARGDWINPAALGATRTNDRGPELPVVGRHLSPGRE